MKMRMITEYDGFESQLEAALHITGLGSKAAVTQSGENILAESQLEVPVDTEALKESGRLEIKKRKYGFTADITYGTVGINPKSKKSTNVYALEVHENLEAHHTIGKAKYLEDPTNRERVLFNARAGNIFTKLFADLNKGR